MTGDSAGVAAAARNAVATGDIPGVVCLVWQGSKLVQLEVAGLRDIEKKLPVERDTIFRIASMSKPVTSVLAMMLIERGAMRLDDPITKWAPEFADMRVLRRPNAPLDETYPSPRAITIEDLLTHRSGLSYGFTSVGPIGYAHEDKLGAVLDSPHAPDEWLTRLASLPLSYPPGERFHYSHATDVLGF